MSILFKLNWLDIGNGFIMAALSASLAGIIDILTVVKNGGALDLPNTKFVLLSGAIGGLTYLLKRLFSDNEGVLFGSNK